MNRAPLNAGPLQLPEEIQQLLRRTMYIPIPELMLIQLYVHVHIGTNHDGPDKPAIHVLYMYIVHALYICVHALTVEHLQSGQIWYGRKCPD
jgi:hypothetical protein